MFKTPLSEKTKREIARLFQESNMPVEEIAITLNVSARSVYNYKNYGYENAEKSMIPMPESTQTKVSCSKGKLRKCRCGYETTERKLIICPKCHTGPFNSISVEVGSPEHARLIEKEYQQKAQPKDICDSTRDYWVCQNCDHISNNEFKICPECGSRDIGFARDGVEPRDPTKYSESSRSSNEESDKEDNGDSPSSDPENKEEEFEWKCPHCGYEFNGVRNRCPKCNTEFEEPWECPKCGHQWYSPPDDYCPKCGYTPQSYF